MSNVRRFETIKGRPRLSLSRRIDVDGQTYSFYLEDRSPRELGSNSLGVSFRDSEIITREISLQRIQDGFGREYWSYRLCADGVVRRWDGGDFTEKRQKERELGIEGPKMSSGNETVEEMGRIILSNLNGIVNDGIPNSRLEEDMGINNQPVTIDEIQGLQGFLARANDVSR